jgi:dethiobiotin synthetase
MNKSLFITGIGTDVGKTIVSAVLVEKLRADYWKPVQSGDLDNSDTMKVQRLVANTVSVFHPEGYRLTQPFSPHKSAQLDGVEILMDNIIAPATNNQLIIEGAGGLMVPLNTRGDMMIDLIKQLDAQVVLVSRNYLGSINHTLLSIDALEKRGISIKMLVFNGETDSYTEDIIQARFKSAGISTLRIPHLPVLDKEQIRQLVAQIEL